MHAIRPAGFLRLLISIAALGLLAGLLFLPAPAQAQTTNTDPTFDSGHSAQVLIPENAPVMTHVGNPYTATDTENDTLTYTLSGTDAMFFSFDSSAGFRS